MNLQLYTVWKDFPSFITFSRYYKQINEACSRNLMFAMGNHRSTKPFVCDLREQQH